MSKELFMPFLDPLPPETVSLLGVAAVYAFV